MQKHGYSRKILSVVLTIAMVFSMMSVGSMTFASAAKATVTKVQVTNLTNKVFYVAKGKTVKLATKVTVKPNKAANKKVSYKSKDKKIATVSSKGVVKGVKVGTTKITVTSKVKKSKKTTITVKVTTPVTKVKLNKSSAALTVGGKTTLSATVSPNKATKNVKWTSSNTNVATVSSKGVVTAKTAGTATITAKAIDGTNKKAICTVTVKKLSTAINMTSASIYNPGNWTSSNTVLVSLSAAKDLKQTDFIVKEKCYSNGKYNRTLDIDYVFTADKKNYMIELDKEIHFGHYYSVTVNALSGVKTKDIFFQPKGKNDYSVIRHDVGDKLDEYGVYFENLLGNLTVKLESGKLPKGITFDAKNSELNGTFEEVANNQKVVFSATDEFGTVSKTTVNFLVGDSNTIIAENKIFNPDQKFYTMRSDSFIVYATGGNVNSYKVSLVDDYDGAFYIDNDGNDYAYVNLESSKLTAGTYTIKVKFEDIDNPEKFTIGTTTVVVNPTVAVTCEVKESGNYNYPAIYFRNTATDEYFYSNGSYTNNKTVANVPVGNYDIYTYDSLGNKVMLKRAYKVSVATTLQLSISNFYKIKVNLTNENTSAENIEYTVRIADKNDNTCAISTDDSDVEFKFVPAGSYDIELTAYDPWSDNSIVLKTTTATVTNADVTINLTFNYTMATPTVDATMTDVGTQEIQGSAIVAFTPSETATYNIYSSNLINDPYCHIYDSAGNQIGSNDDYEGLNFRLSIELTAGQTYYLNVRDYENESFTLNIEKA